MAYIYYVLKANQERTDMPLAEGYTLKIYSPKLSKLSKHTGFNLMYLIWYFLTLGHFKIYYVYDKNSDIVHYSHVMPKIFKYAFMPRKNSMHIGPCWTSENSRGKGLYPSVLSQITKDYQGENIYIFTAEDNIPSRKGIEKVNFKKFASGHKTKGFGIYQIEKDTA